MIFDNFFSKIVLSAIFFIILLGIFWVYSPYSSDRIYMDFLSQIKFIKEIVINGHLDNGIIKDISNVFNVTYWDKDKIILLSSYKTDITLYLGKNIYAEIKTVSNDGVVPVKSIVDVDSFLDDGLPNSGIIKSLSSNYYSGCVIVVSLK